MPARSGFVQLSFHKNPAYVRFSCGEGDGLAVVGEGVALHGRGRSQKVGGQEFGGCPLCDKYDSFNALGLEGGNAAEPAGEHGPVGLHGDGENAVAPGRFIAYVLPVPVRNAVEGGSGLRGGCRFPGGLGRNICAYDGLGGSVLIHIRAGGVILDPTGRQVGGVRLDLCTGYLVSVRFAAAVADACARSASPAFNTALHLQLCVAGNGDVFSFALQTATDACAVYAAGGLDLAAGDGDVTAVTAVAAADARTVAAAGGLDLAAGDGDVAAGAPPSRRRCPRHKRRRRWR